MVSVIAIFDIGKTNKKFFLFNEDYKIVEESSKTFTEIEDEDGFPCENLQVLSKWVRNTLSEYLQDSTYDIKAINFSAYGASFVHLDRENNIVTPLYNYLKPYPIEIEKQFYDIHGTKEAISLTTASPALGNLNSGLQLYALKYRRPEIFSRIAASLHLPQYMSFLISGKHYADITSIGCHTALWDFTTGNYHDWVFKEGIDKKMPPLFPGTDVIDIVYNNKPLKCGVGLHDSSSAFIPYIKHVNEPFLLISTGTWCISMNAFNNTPLTQSELENDCLCYMTYEGATVKSSRLMAGYAHEIVVKKLSDYFGTELNYFEKIAFDKNLIRKEPPLKDLTSFDVSAYASYEEAYMNFMKQIVLAQKASTDLVINNTIKKLFVDGGFAKNEVYMQLLADAYPHIEVYAASVSQASAIGAAMVLHRHWNRFELSNNMINLRRFHAASAFD